MAFADDRTARFPMQRDGLPEAARIMREVYRALEERGYNPVSQIVGYLLSGDPTYITTHRGARQLIRGVERDELLEELVTRYVEYLSATRQE